MRISSLTGAHVLEKILKCESYIFVVSKAATLPTATKQDEEFVDTFSRTINGEKISDLQPDLFTGGRLRKYQLEGVEWLKVSLMTTKLCHWLELDFSHIF